MPTFDDQHIYKAVGYSIKLSNSSHVVVCATLVAPILQDLREIGAIHGTHIDRWRAQFLYGSEHQGSLLFF
jgi:hypothetical protein